MAKRLHNKCKSCGYTWYPKGKNISTKCPRCYSTAVDITLLEKIKAIFSLLFFIFFIAIIFFSNTDTSNKKSETSNIDQSNQSKQTTETNQSEPAIEAGKTWTGDWGNGIVATMTTEPCDISDFTKLDYKYAMSVTIPIARLKKPTDAWHIDGDKATTMMGCWFRTSGLSIHAKMIRKNDGKVTEQNFRLDDGNWSSK
jgi:hypothetical protein